MGQRALGEGQALRCNWGRVTEHKEVNTACVPGQLIIGLTLQREHLINFWDRGGRDERLLKRQAKGLYQ